MDNLVLVDEDDNVKGYETKEQCHDGKGILHRAFSVFIFNSKKELLIQKRSSLKRLWPLHWSNTCCSHPRKNESYESAAERRLKEETGIECRLKYLYKFIYQADYSGKGSENEVCAVLIGRSDDNMKANPEEIAEWKWISIGQLVLELEKIPEKYTPWFRMEVKELLATHKKEIIGI